MTVDTVSWFTVLGWPSVSPSWVPRASSTANQLGFAGVGSNRCTSIALGGSYHLSETPLKSDDLSVIGRNTRCMWLWDTCIMCCDEMYHLTFECRSLDHFENHVRCLLRTLGCWLGLVSAGSLSNEMVKMPLKFVIQWTCTDSGSLEFCWHVEKDPVVCIVYGNHSIELGWASSLWVRHRDMSGNVRGKGSVGRKNSVGGIVSLSIKETHIFLEIASNSCHFC